MDGYRMPAEWEPHAACWLAWPYIEEWGSHLPPARRELVELVRAIVDVDPATGTPRGEAARVLLARGEHLTPASQAFGSVPATFDIVQYGDIWTRDIAPSFVRDSAGQLAATTFRFDGWGGKYVFEGDAEVGAEVAELAGVPCAESRLVTEGGAIEVDGEGTILTTRPCILDPKRNPGLERAEAEALLCEALGGTRVLWLERGLANDHTDGHVDTIARFVAPGVVVCMEPRSEGDPNREVLGEIIRDLSSMDDARGRRLEVVRIPSPGRVDDEDGVPMPASYANFYVANTTVIVPTYGTRWDDEAVERIAALFPSRRTLGLSARAILSGGGAFHCITQQEPTRQVRS